MLVCLLTGSYHHAKVHGAQCQIANSVYQGHTTVLSPTWRTQGPDLALALSSAGAAAMAPHKGQTRRRALLMVVLACVVAQQVRGEAGYEGKMP